MASIEDLYSAMAHLEDGQEDGQDAPAAGRAPLVVRAGQLASEVTPVDPECTNAQLHAYLLSHPERDTVAVVKDGVPLGLINRNVFMEQYGKPFGRELFGKESCVAFADRAALITPVETPIELLVRHAVQPDTRVMKDGFICTRDGRYAGIGSGMALLKAMSDIEAEKTRQLLSSIDYASAIQQSNLRTSLHELQRQLPASRLVWMPRDVVGGDCYFFRATREGLFGAIIDCTGHGVPGAFMTLIALSYLEGRVASGDPAPDPAEILTGLNRHIKKVLAQGEGERERAAAAGPQKSDDGLDAFMFTLDGSGRHLRYAGARLELAVAVPGQDEVLVFEGDRMGVGYSDTPDAYPFTLGEALLPPGYRALLSTDGVIDQIGGPKRIAHGRKRLYKLLQQNRRLAPREFGNLLVEEFAAWQGAQRRRDDVCFLAFAGA